MLTTILLILLIIILLPFALWMGLAVIATILAFITEVF